MGPIPSTSTSSSRSSSCTVVSTCSFIARKFHLPHYCLLGKASFFVGRGSFCSSRVIAQAANDQRLRRIWVTSFPATTNKMPYSSTAVAALKKIREDKRERDICRREEQASARRAGRHQATTVSLSCSRRLTARNIRQDNHRRGMLRPAG